MKREKGRRDKGRRKGNSGLSMIERRKRERKRERNKRKKKKGRKRREKLKKRYRWTESLKEMIEIDRRKKKKETVPIIG